MGPVQDRRIVDAEIGENTSKAWTTVGKAGQRGVVRSADGIEVPADQHRDVRFGSGDGAENLAPASLRFDVANSYLQVTFSVLATSDEGGIQGDRSRRALVSGSIVAQSRSAAPDVRVWRRMVSRSLPTPTGNICSSISAAVR